MSDLDQEKANLQAAIEGLYTTYASYRLDHPVEGCPHCVSDEDMAQLYAKPLRFLLPDDLDKFAFKALTTWGDVDDFKHFLPRIFELMTLPAGLITNSEIVVGKLPYGHWKEWPVAERQAIKTFLAAWWRWTLVSTSDYQMTFQVDGVLESIACAEADLQPYLAIWTTILEKFPATLAVFAIFIADQGDRLVREGKLDWVWKASDDQNSQVLNWLSDPTILARLEQAFFKLRAKSENTELNELFSEAVNYLSLLAS